MHDQKRSCSNHRWASVSAAGLMLFLLLGAGALADDDGPGSAAVQPAGSPVSMVDQDPQAFLRMCREQGPPRLEDFRCVYLQNERMGRKLTGEQVINVVYRREPRAVSMTWARNPQGADSAVWMKDRHRTADGQQSVLVDPSGVAGMVVKHIFLPLTDKRVRKASRRPITEFGPDATLKRILRDNEAARRRGVLKLTYQGPGTVDGRPTYMLVRRLPYERGGTYPDARMVLHIDQEWLVPVSIISYTDTKKQSMLESYIFTRIQPNIGLSDEDFGR